MPDLISKARTFLQQHLDSTQTSLHESSAVNAIVGFFNHHSKSVEQVPVTETTEYKQVKSQRDHNWNELQKALATIGELQAQVTQRTKQSSTPDEAAK